MTNHTIYQKYLPEMATNHQQLDKVSEGRRPGLLLNATRTDPTYNFVQLYMESYSTKICNKPLWNPANNESIHSPWSPWNRLAGALQVSHSGPRVFRDTITAISMWRPSSGSWFYVAAHSSTVLRTMTFMFKCLQLYHIRNTEGFGYCVRKPKDTETALVNFVPRMWIFLKSP